MNVDKSHPSLIGWEFESVTAPPDLAEETDVIAFPIVSYRHL